MLWHVLLAKELCQCIGSFIYSIAASMKKTSLRWQIFRELIWIHIWSYICGVIGVYVCDSLCLLDLASIVYFLVFLIVWRWLIILTVLVAQKIIHFTLTTCEVLEWITYELMYVNLSSWHMSVWSSVWIRLTPNSDNLFVLKHVEAALCLIVLCAYMLGGVLNCFVFDWYI